MVKSFDVNGVPNCKYYSTGVSNHYTMTVNDYPEANGNTIAFSTANGVYYILYLDIENLRLDAVDIKGIGYYNTSSVDTSADKLLAGNSMFTSKGLIKGTMRNNGELNYTPTTSNQAIPAGYTSGGTVTGVTSAIDANIIPENIKKDVTILGVVGNVEIGIMTEEEYNNCETLANEILSSSFPYSYTEYTEFDGNSYTTLPYHFTNNMSYEITLQDLGSPKWAVLLGDGAQTLQVQYEDTSLLYINRGGGADNGDWVRSDLNMSAINTFKQDLANFKVNGEVRLTLGENAVFTSTSDIHMGVVEPTNTTYAKMRVYGFKLWDNTTLICDLVPVRRLTDNVAGLYDKVNKIFYTSLTTTSFISGGDL